MTHGIMHQMHEDVGTGADALAKPRDGSTRRAQHCADRPTPNHVQDLGSHAPCDIIAAWWPCTPRVAMLPLPRAAVMLMLTSLTVTNSLPLCGAGRRGAPSGQNRRV